MRWADAFRCIVRFHDQVAVFRKGAATSDVVQGAHFTSHVMFSNEKSDMMCWRCRT